MTKLLSVILNFFPKEKIKEKEKANSQSRKSE